MPDNTARTIATSAIWVSAAVILAFGVFRFNWNGDNALLALMFTVLMVCGGATISTVVIWVGSKHKSTGARGFEVLPVSPESSNLS